MISLLLERSRGASYINFQNDNGDSCLHLAISKNNVEMVKLLLKQDKVNPNLANSKGETPLHLAALQSLEMVETLLSIPYVNGNVHTHHGESPLFYAMKANERVAIAEILYSRNPETLQDLDSEGQTLLHQAVTQGILIVKWILEKNQIDINQADYDNLTAIHFAIEQHHNIAREMEGQNCEGGSSIFSVILYLLSLPNIDLSKVPTRRGLVPVKTSELLKRYLEADLKKEGIDISSF